MTYLLATYWLPLLLAVILGAVVGFFTFSHPARGWWPQSWPNGFKLLAAIFVVGLIIAWLALIPGRAGHYLETALLLLAGYFLGCLAGSWLASLAGTAEKPMPKAEAAAPAPAVAATPVVATPVAAAPVSEASDDEHSLEAAHPGARPAAVEQSGTPDDLKIISGIGPKNEMLLHRLGVFYFRQIAEWNDDNIQWVDSYLKFKGRIQREDWVDQAKRLARGEKL